MVIVLSLLPETTNYKPLQSVNITSKKCTVITQMMNRVVTQIDRLRDVYVQTAKQRTAETSVASSCQQPSSSILVHHPYTWLSQ